MQSKYFEHTPLILNHCTEIGRLLGYIDAVHLRKPKTELRKKNKIQSIRASLAIEGNTLSEEQVTAIMENRRVIGPAKDILEVQNAIKIYASLTDFDPFSEASYLKAHMILMNGLVKNAGKYRNKGVGIVQGSQVAHLAPPAWNVPHLMKELFEWLKFGADNLLIKSCVFHYEMEFIHPFFDGNGRMGRLWQTLILMKYNPVFEYLPFEKSIKESQDEYYKVLGESDKTGLSTKFIEYALEKILIGLENLSKQPKDNLGEEDRIRYFLDYFEGESFNRKDYLDYFPNISPPTASRDLKHAVDLGLITKLGEKRLTRYKKS